MNALIQTLLEKGTLLQGSMGYSYLNLKKSKKELIEATMYLMEDVALGRIQVIKDRFGKPMWYTKQD